MAGHRRIAFACAVAAAVVLLALGFSLPFLRIDGQSHSLLAAVSILFRSGQALLGGALLTLAVVVPLHKLLYLVLLAALPAVEINRSAATLRALAWLGRWSPHDLLALVAAAVVIVSHAGLTHGVGLGAYCFAAAVLAMVLAPTFLSPDAAARLRHSLHAPSAPRGRVFSVLVALAVASFGLGVALPAIRLANAYATAEPQSLVGIVLALKARGEIIVWVALAALALILPALRLLHLALLLATRSLSPGVRAKVLLAAGLLGRHATLDATVLSLALFYLLATRQVDAALGPGVYAFAASACLTLAAYAWASLPAAAVSVQRSSLGDRLAAVAAGKATEAS